MLLLLLLLEVVSGCGVQLVGMLRGLVDDGLDGQVVVGARVVERRVAGLVEPLGAVIEAVADLQVVGVLGAGAARGEAAAARRR